MAYEAEEIMRYPSKKSSKDASENLTSIWGIIRTQSGSQTRRG
jgi:hypothetical protein